MIDFIKGFRALLHGFGLIIQPGVRLYVLVPMLINTVLFLGIIVLGAQQLSDFINTLSGWWQWLEWLLWPLFAIVTFTIVFFTFSIVANLIGAPFNGFLAEAVESYVTGQPIKSQDNTLLREIIKAIKSESIKFVYFIVRAVPLLILLFIPGLQILWILFGAWMLALEYMDYPMGNHGYTFPEERQLIKKHRWLALGFGTAVMLMTLIPFINFIAMPVAVAAATKLWLDEIKS